MSENIVDLAIKFKEKTKAELQKYSDDQYRALVAAAQKITELQAEVEHLKQLLTTTVSIVQDSNVESVIKSPELCVVEAQIEILSRRALQLEMTLEDAKLLDILIKNKKLLTGEATTIVAEKKLKQKYSDAELVKIASEPKKIE